MGVAEEMIHVAYPGFDPGVWWPLADGESRAGLHEFGITKPYIIFIGTIQPRKGITTLIKGYELARKKLDSEIQLVVLGNMGWKYKEIELVLRRAIDQNELVFYNGADDKKVASLLRGASSLVMPSIYEGFGLPVLEAMASGCAVIASDIPVFREILGDVGVFFNVGNHEELCEQICTVFRDDVLQQEMRRKGLIRADDFSWEKCVKTTWSVYESIVGEP